jgi:hypothetical protein
MRAYLLVIGLPEHIF